ncbi:GLPGLI family protein [Cruoricaptor ignavus]|uniref:GLPGLI family protein n=1 Tax=Cruoricaptor ignavus TaxID=1118202 RepID=UPI00370DBC61
MKNFLFLFLFCQFSIFSGQEFSMIQRFTAPKFRSDIKEKSDFVVLYEITFSDGKGKSSIAKTLLQSGYNYSKFLDVNTIGRNSLIQAHSKLESVGAKELNELGQFNVAYKKSVLKDYLSNSILYQERLFKNTYQYSEPIPKIKWILGNSEKTLLGYKCKSASTDFRGRKYNAWYTEEIPKSDGPYIFQGLPGLILQITDEVGTYDFTAVAIEKKKMNIYWRNEENIVPVTRENFRKMQQNYFENPGIFMSGKAFDQYGNEISLQNKKRLYLPLELE